jgi:hypothetical protein
MNDNTYEAGQNSSDTVSSSEEAGRSRLEAQEKPVDPVCLNYAGGQAFENGRDEPAQGFLELVYGVLFEPVKTFKKAARRPPLSMAILLVTILGLAGVLMWLLTVSRVINQTTGPLIAGQFFSATRPVLVLGAVTMFLWGYIKWFGYSAFISLAAEMTGGTGRGRDVAAIVGLSLIPTILMIPAQLLNYYLSSSAFIVIVILVVWIWVTALMVIGVREVHGLSTGRTLLVVLSPVLILAVFAGLLLAAMVAVAMSMYTVMDLPGNF